MDEGGSRDDDRGLLPDQRPVPGARGHARALRRRLPGDRRHALLRARRDQGRARLPDAAREPGGHGGLRADRQLAAARDRRRPRRAGSWATRTRSASRSGTWRPRRRPCPALGAAAVKAVGRFMSVMERLRERAEGGAGVGDLLQETLEETGYLEALEAERTIEAQGRLENLEELVGVGREYDATRRRRSPRSRSSSSRSRSSPSRTACATSEGMRHADDAPQRQGPRVRHRVHHRPRGRRVPALARDRGGRPRGGAPALLRRHHPRQARALPHATPARAACSAARDWNLRSRFIDEIPVELTDRDEEAPTGPAAAATWEGGAAAPDAGPRRSVVRARRRRGARQLRRRRGHRHRARRARGRALRRPTAASAS